MMVRLARILLLPLTGAALLGACTDDPDGDPSAGTTGASADATTGDEPTTAAEPTTGDESGGPTSSPTR